MFERFTERARQVIVLAQDEARALRHDWLGTEHLLLGLLREEEGIAARLLASFDVGVDEVRAQVARIVGSGEEPAPAELPFTPRSKRVIELSLREAASLGHGYIGTEHLLLGLLRENDGVAVQILRDLDVDGETLRTELLRALGGPSARSSEQVVSKRMTAARKANPGLASEVDRVVAEKERAIDAGDFDRAATLRDEERRLVARLLGRAEPSDSAPAPGPPRRGEAQLAVAVPEPPGWRTLVTAGTAVAGGVVGLLVGWLIWG